MKRAMLKSFRVWKITFEGSMIRNQLSMQEARKLFDYRDGLLFWRHAGSGRRRDGVAIINKGGRKGGNKKYVRVGEARIPARYAVWNWHHGITRNRITIASGDNSDLHIENLREVDDFIGPLLPPARISCPCCSQRVPIPTARVISINCGLTPKEQRILEAVWSGNGAPVQVERIFSKMYEDDPNGGPEPAKMYLSFKVAMNHLRNRLAGSGVSIENVGYRRGYKLIVGSSSCDDAQR